MIDKVGTATCAFPKYTVIHTRRPRNSNECLSYLKISYQDHAEKNLIVHASHSTAIGSYSV